LLLLVSHSPFVLLACILLQVMRGLKPHERVNELILIAEPFSMGNGQLTQTLKVKRHKVLEVYNDLI